MPVEEIRWWMLELMRNRGWTRGAMIRTLGIHRVGCVWRKALGKEWIYPTEQVRWSRQLQRIISGELVLKQRVVQRNKPSRGAVKGAPMVNRGVPVLDAVLADNPQPLRMPMKMHWDVKSGRIGLTPQYLPPENPLPSFKTLLDKPRKWVWPE